MRGFALLASVAAILGTAPLRAEFRQVNITTLGMD